MSDTAVTYTGGLIFDGAQMHNDRAARFSRGTFVGLINPGDAIDTDTIVDLKGDILSPGYVDLQVNGGGGVMFNDDPSAATLRQMSDAHRGLGVASFLPTLITDTAEKTQAAIAAVRDALARGVPAIAGLHLEGPHLSVARKGAHDAALIRPMDQSDLDLLLEARETIDRLKVTLAPENVTLDQVRTLTHAGVLVSLGHTDADFETCLAYAKAGARCVTHLFNAMSQLGSRAPGLVGAALQSGDLSAGLIADAVHVHPATMRAAWHSKARPGEIYLVSDAMAVAGTNKAEFTLGGRRISRRDGRLTLEDGNLAGADLDLTTALRVLVAQVGVDLSAALRAATSVPAGLVGLNAGLTPDVTPQAGVIRISKDLSGASFI